jgi:hypothetical protein
MTRYIAEWAIRIASDKTFEPSCGEAFMLGRSGRDCAALRAPVGTLGDQQQG